MATNANFFQATQESEHQTETQYPRVAIDNHKQILIEDEKLRESKKIALKVKPPSWDVLQLWDVTPFLPGELQSHDLHTLNCFPSE